MENAAARSRGRRKAEGRGGRVIIHLAQGRFKPPRKHGWRWLCALCSLNHRRRESLASFDTPEAAREDALTHVTLVHEGYDVVLTVFPLRSSDPTLPGPWVGVCEPCGAIVTASHESPDRADEHLENHRWAAHPKGEVRLSVIQDIGGGEAVLQAALKMLRSKRPPRIPKSPPDVVDF